MSASLNLRAAEADFEQDAFPGRPKLLFVGLAESSHTHSWIALLKDAQLNVRLFAMPTHLPPDGWAVRTYLTTSRLKPGLDPATRLSLHPLPEQVDSYEADYDAWIRSRHMKKLEWEDGLRAWTDRMEDLERRKQRWHEKRGAWELRRQEWAAKRLKQLERTPSYLFFRMARKLFFTLARLIQYPFGYGEIEIAVPAALQHVFPQYEEPFPEAPSDEPDEYPAFDDHQLDHLEPDAPQPRAATAEQWLADIIRGWRPDVIHTLGLYDLQGGEFFFKVRRDHHLEGIGKWVLQLRGGSDLALRRHEPRAAAELREVLEACDQILPDNPHHVEYLRGLGLGEKIAGLAPVPGTGGMEVADDSGEPVPPSRRERIILWPKAYESRWSKALPVLEAFRLAWDRIKPCKIHMTAVDPETMAWFWTLPEEIRADCVLKDRIPRAELLDLMRHTRILLAPSLIDGVPNSLYEAMLNGAFPILSPLASIAAIVQDGVNVLFARNLYPEEISRALVMAMTDDTLVDRAASANRSLVDKIASRKTIAGALVEFYEQL